MCRLVGYLMAVGAGVLILLGLASISLASYLHDPIIFFKVLGMWCLCGMLFNRWMLSPVMDKGGAPWAIWLWSVIGCWAWPMGVVYGLVWRLAPPEEINK